MIDAVTYSILTAVVVAIIRAIRSPKVWTISPNG
jgi:hypothetical protein